MQNKNEQDVLLRVEHLSQYFKNVKAVDDVSFTIKKGEVFGLVGESGCGKTTTGRSIIKIYDITSGSIYFKGRRVCAGTRSYKDAIAEAKRQTKEELKALREETAKAPEKRAANEKRAALCKAELKKVIDENREQIARAQYDHKHADEEYAKERTEQVKQEYSAKLEAAKNEPEKLAALKKEYKNALQTAEKSRLITQIQMIFQDPIASLNPRMTVREIISEGLVINGIKDQKYIDEKVYEILEMVGLVREHASRYPHEFSGGQRQRIGIARAVIMHPELLIADEPISALDVSVQAQIINLLNELRTELGLTILFIAHDLSVVKYFSDRIGVMYFGKLVELSDADELFAHPLHPYTKSLLSAIPLPDPVAEKHRTRVVYNNLTEHDYSVDKPSMREIVPGHFVYCNDAEEQRYRKEMGL